MPDEIKKPEFASYSDRIRARHGNMLDFESEQCRDLITDFYESWEDLEIIHPLLTSIVSRDLSDKEFEDALYKLDARLWHTIDHLTSIKKILEEL